MVLPDGSSFEDFLSAYADELRQFFRSDANRAQIPQHDVDDLFQEWCIRTIQRFRRNPDAWLPIVSDIAERERRYAYLPWQSARWPRGSRSSWLWWLVRRLWLGEPWRSPASSRGQRLVVLGGYDLDSIEAPTQVPMESLVPEPEAVSALAEVLSLDDIDMLLCLRLSSQTDAATSLGLTVSEFDARFRAFSSRVRRLGQRVMSAVRWVLRGRVLFLSSTYSDLKEHREAIIVKLHRLAANGLPIVVLAMEHLLPGRGHPGGRCIEWVRRSDVYIGVFGMRYGSIWKDRGIGFTEAELREAERIDLERCLYVSHESCDMPHDAGDSDKKERIEALRGELSARYVVGFFVSPRDVAEQIGDKVATMFWS